MKQIISGLFILALVLTLGACSFGGTISTDPTLDTTTPAGSISQTQNQQSAVPSRYSRALPLCWK